VLDGMKRLPLFVDCCTSNARIRPRALTWQLQHFNKALKARFRSFQMRKCDLALPQGLDHALGGSGMQERRNLSEIRHIEQQKYVPEADRIGQNPF